MKNIFELSKSLTLIKTTIPDKINVRHILNRLRNVSKKRSKKFKMKLNCPYESKTLQYYEDNFQLIIDCNTAVKLYGYDDIQ